MVGTRQVCVRWGGSRFHLSCLFSRDGRLEAIGDYEVSGPRTSTSASEVAAMSEAIFTLEGWLNGTIGSGPFDLPTIKRIFVQTPPSALRALSITLADKEALEQDIRDPATKRFQSKRKERAIS